MPTLYLSSLRIRELFVIAITTLLLSQSASADDWPQWRGANRDGVWKETGLVKKFKVKQLKYRWRAKIGSGYSGPTVAAGRIYVTDRVTKPKQIERVHCFDEKTGKPIWSHSYDCTYVKVGYKAGPRASVTIDGERAYSLGAMGHLFCFDAAKGKVLWSKDNNKLYKIRMPIWGIAAAPLVEKNLVIVQIGGEKACLVAFDKKTGKEVWKARSDRASYSSPIMVTQGEKRVMICWTGDYLLGMNPADGKVYWQHRFKPTRMVINIATPVVRDNWLFVTSFYDGSMMVKLDPKRPKSKKVWRLFGPDERNTKALHSIIATPYIQDDHVYGVDSYGQLRCLDAKDGKRVWEDLSATAKVRWSNIHMVQNDKQLWMFNELGQLLIGKVSPKGFEEISRTQLIEPTRVQLSRGRRGVCWAHPAYANKCVFARNDNELVCASLAEEDHK